MAKKASSQDSSLAQLRLQLEKSKQINLAEIEVVQDNNTLKNSIPHIPTGSVIIDYLIGGKKNAHDIEPCPGIPRGKITHIYGWNSSGKTTLALTCAATCIANGGTVLYMDYEHEIDISYAASLGIPVTDKNKFWILQPLTLEQGYAISMVAAAKGTDLIVFDSVGAGITKETYELTTEDIAKGDRGRLGQNAAAWAFLLPKIKGILARTQTAMIGISQMRRAPAKNEAVVQGGEAFKFYAAVRIKLSRIGYESEKEYDAIKHKIEDKVRVGQVIRANLDKCKVSDAAQKSADFYIKFGLGIDDCHSILDIACSHKVVKQAGAWISWGEHKFQGTAQTLDFLRKNKKEFIELYKATIPYLKDSKLAHGQEIETSMDEDNALDDLLTSV